MCSLGELVETINNKTLSVKTKLETLGIYIKEQPNNYQKVPISWALHKILLELEQKPERYHKVIYFINLVIEGLKDKPSPASLKRSLSDDIENVLSPKRGKFE